VGGVELVETADDLADLGELGQVDLAGADQLEDELAELRQGAVAAARGERFVEPLATFAGTALEDLTCGTQQGSQGAAQLGRSEATTPTSLTCHVTRLPHLIYRRRAVTNRLWLALAIMLATMPGCPAPEPPPVPIPPVSAGKVRVRVFTEPSPVRGVGAVGKIVFVATEDAVERWDEAGNVLAMTADHGLPGAHISAIATDPEHKRLWILTDGGFGTYDTVSQVYSEVAAAPAALGIDYAAIGKEGVACLAAGDGGVWLGTAKGLFFVSDKGGWVPSSIRDPVRALLRDRAGWVWIASKFGLFTRKPNGDIIKLSYAQGVELAEPRVLVDAPGDRVLAIGSDEQGHERIAIGKQLLWTSYRTLPEIAWSAATRRGNAIIVMGGDRVYRITTTADGNAVRPLARDGLRLVPLSGGTTSEWTIDLVDMVVPPGATVLASTDDQLLIGTRDLGTARYHDGETGPHDWLRRKQMFEDATTLSVACARVDDCWIATGARQAWHWTGEHFIAGGPDQVVLAVAKDPGGPIYALHRAVSEKEIHLSRIDGAAWTPLAKVVLATPGDAPEISFAHFASSGSLWVGLRYREGNERHAYGLAIVDPASGKVAYHRTESGSDPGKKPSRTKMLPIPVGVVDADVRGDTAWFATNEGVARLVGNQVKVWTEADGLRSELARAVTIAPDGGVIVATGAGAGIWDGKMWDFPAALRFEVNDVVTTRNGQVWMATERGIAAWDGKKVRRVDARRGLAENTVLDVTVDQFDRVWARGPGSLTLISQ